MDGYCLAFAIFAFAMLLSVSYLSIKLLAFQIELHVVLVQLLQLLAFLGFQLFDL